MPSPILARADALMQRRRQGPTDNDEVPVLTDSVSDDDIPVLTDAEPTVDRLAIADFDAPQAAPEIFSPPVLETPPAMPPTQPETPRFDPAIREQLLLDLARRVEQRIASELPRLVESTVRDFLAEQAMIDLAPPNT